MLWLSISSLLYLCKRVAMLRMFPKVPTSPVRRVSTPEMRNLNRSSISDSSPGLPHLTTISAEQEIFRTKRKEFSLVFLTGGRGVFYSIYIKVVLWNIWILYINFIGCLTWNSIWFKDYTTIVRLMLAKVLIISNNMSCHFRQFWTCFICLQKSGGVKDFTWLISVFVFYGGAT